MVSFQLATLAHNVFIYFLGFATLFLELRLLYAMRYIKWISTLGITLKKAAGTLASIGVWYGLFFIACSCFFTLMFGSDVYEYHSMQKTTSTVTMLTVDFRGFDKFPNTVGPFGGFVLLLYAMVCLVIFINFFLTLFNDVLHSVKRDKKIHKDDEVIDHFLGIFKSLFQARYKTGKT